MQCSCWRSCEQEVLEGVSGNPGKSASCRDTLQCAATDSRSKTCPLAVSQLRMGRLSGNSTTSVQTLDIAATPKDCKYLSKYPS